MNKQLFFVVALLTVTQTFCMNPALSKLAQSLTRYKNSPQLVALLQNSGKEYSQEELDIIRDAFLARTFSGRTLAGDEPCFGPYLDSSKYAVEVYENFIMRTFPAASRQAFMDVFPHTMAYVAHRILKNTLVPERKTSEKIEDLRSAIVRRFNSSCGDRPRATYEQRHEFIADLVRKTDAELLEIALNATQNDPASRVRVAAITANAANPTQVLDQLLGTDYRWEVERVLDKELFTRSNLLETY